MSPRSPCENKDKNLMTCTNAHCYFYGHISDGGQMLSNLPRMVCIHGNMQLMANQMFEVGMALLQMDSRSHGNGHEGFNDLP